MFNKIILTIKFILLVSIFGKNRKASKNIIIIDGPSSISVSNRISTATNDVSFFVPFCYMPTVLKSGLAWNLVIAPTLPEYMVAFAKTCIGLKNRDFATILIALQVHQISFYIKKYSRSITNVIVYNERGPFASSAITTAKKYNIRTCCIQHGAIVENYFPIEVDIYFTWSDYFSDVIKGRCTTVLPINVGRLDYSAPLTRTIKKIDVPLVALQPAGTSIPYELLLDNFIDVVEVCLIVFDSVVLRQHPNDNISIDLLAFFNGDKRITFDNCTLYESLAERKIVISLYSTVLLDASIMGCLALQYATLNWFKPIFQRSNILFNNKQDLKNFLNEFKNNSNFSTVKFGNELIGQPNYDLFFNTLSLD